jgi:hypothetical protein
MGLRVFIALTTFAVGMGLFAVAAILFDRRRALRQWMAARRVRAAARANPGGGVGTVPAVTTLPLVGIILGCLLLGTILVFGSCAGLILW